MSWWIKPEEFLKKAEEFLKYIKNVPEDERCCAYCEWYREHPNDPSVGWCPIIDDWTKGDKKIDHMEELCLDFQYIG